MTNKFITHSYVGMQKDISNSKYQPNFYYDAKNIKINATTDQSTSSITNEKGNSLLFSIPIPIINYETNVINYASKTLSYTTSEIIGDNQSSIQYIIGNTTYREGAILFTTDNLGCDCVWKFRFSDNDLELLYLRNMGFSTSRPIQAINNFENINIDKVYWVDGLNQLRFINIEHSIINEDLEELIDIPLSVINMVGKSTLTQPVITNISVGGIHTSGRIQYAYNLYRLNSSQTKISPFSELISLDKGALGGGEINESVSSAPIITITNIDTSYTNIRIYAIKYTSYNEIPSISLIDDRAIPSTGIIEIFDDGNIISTLSLEEFIFLGSDIIIPKHINTKFNRLFLANYNEINFNVDIDTKAYSFAPSGESIIYKDLFLDGNVPNGTPFIIVNDIDYDNPELIKHDSVNLNYNVYKYQKDGITLGGEGKYLKYKLTQDTVYNKNNQYFKDDEIYRIGIEFFNNYGQFSQPKWIADFRAPSGNLTGNYNTLEVTLKPELFSWLSTNVFESDYQKPIGYKIMIAERTINDRTIIANGLVSPMMVNDKSNEDIPIDYSSVSDVNYVRDKAKTLPKLPNFTTRNCNTFSNYGLVQPLYKAKHLKDMNTLRNSPDTEIQRADVGSDTSGRLYQFNSMLQLYSPEVMFGNTVSVSDSTKLRVKGSLKNNINNSWSRKYEASQSIILDEVKALGGLTQAYSTSFDPILGEAAAPLNMGLISHPADSNPDRVTHTMFHRGYGNLEPELGINDLFTPSISETILDIYGKPEVTEKGQSGTNYNNDPNYRYVNSLQGVLTDANTYFDNDGKFQRRIVSINSYGNRCITIVPGLNNPSINHWDRPKLESIFLSTGLSGDNNGIIVELIKNDNEIYLGNIYGGNSYEDKLRTNYIEIGTFKELNSLDTTINISSPGDTYVNTFTFARIVRTDVDIMAEGTYVLEEIVQFITETTIDLKNRNDLSLQPWDARFQPYDSEYHKYNKVYSQLPNLAQRRSVDYNTKRFNNFDTNVIATKVKSAGEIIDNWTDIQTNEVITLDGKHGSINSLTSFNDELYTIQDKALAFLSINPRVQVQGQDGLAIQLGSGSVLDRYKYISTDSGTLNKWSVITSPQSMYYYDTLNSSIMSFKGGLENLTDFKGLHTFFTNNISSEVLKIDNPILKTGVSSGYDYSNHDLFMTFNQTGKPSFTLSYNETRNQFISYHDYLPSNYISKGDYTFTTNPLNTSIYRQGIGNYNNFYGVNYSSYVVLNVNPEVNMDTVFDNIMYKSEVYLNDVDQPNKTLTKVRLYSEYQDSGLIPLTLSRTGNLRRKFRDWNAILPRNQGSRERIRNPWVKLVLQFDNTSNYKLILHDVIISYSV
jgi:hypothetical protein